MKNPRLERMRRQMRDYHRSQPWRLTGGLFIPHAYPEQKRLSWWDDVGFVLNRCRVMVWWVHPRMKYAEAIEKQAMHEAGPLPDEPMFEGPLEKRWRRIGRSRKKLAACRTHVFSDPLSAYFDQVNAVEEQLRAEGIDHVVRPSMSGRWYRWGIGIDLCIPIEVRNIEEARHLAGLARILLKREGTISEAFPSYAYGREEWLGEAENRPKSSHAATTNE